VENDPALWAWRRCRGALACLRAGSGRHRANGAGKTTLLNALSGFYVPDSGGIRLREVPVAGRPPYAIARLGVARTFQTAQVFGDLSVAENVAVGVAGPRLGSVVAALVGAPWTASRSACAAAPRFSPKQA
jgi:ABC-type branched-subunit amino acid transport system ATPase component